MIRYIYFLVLISMFIFSGSMMGQNSKEMSFYDFTIESIDGKPLDFSSFKGKYVMCVNVASECGNTPQYSQLQEMSDLYKDNLVIVGFPCNQFGGQEPGDNMAIKSFCQKNYGVTFPLTNKIDVKGTNQHPIYSWLTSQKINDKPVNPVKWNFHKYLIDPKGRLIGDFKDDMDPASEEILNMIQ